MITSNLSFGCAILMAIITAGSVPCEAATVLVGNLGEPVRGATPIGNPEFWGAQSFQPDANSYQLDSILALVGNSANAPLVVAELRGSDMGGEIDVTAGGLVATFGVPDVSGAPSPRMFTPNAPVTLMPSTKYWFILGSASAGTFDWSFADNNNFTGPGILENFADSDDAGFSWRHRDDSFPYHMQVNVAQIPEPASVILPGCAAVCLIAFRRCLKSRRRSLR